MVDYTTKDDGIGNFWLYLIAGAVVLIVLLAIFGGGSGSTTSIDPLPLASEPEAEITAPAATD